MIILSVDILKNTYPENTDIANAIPIPKVYIIYSASIFFIFLIPKYIPCLLYTSDAADD